MNNNDNFLSVEHLTVEYTSGGDIVHAVNDVSFSLKRGQTLGLVGETGAGKTTIAKAIMGILPTPPAILKDGKILLDNEDLVQLPENKMCHIRGERVAMIFQDPMTALNPLMSVGEQISEVIGLHSPETTKSSEIRARAEEMLELVGIPRERYMEYPFQFSGGMKQRVVIAMALACDPELLLADEPTTALDVTIQAQVLELIKDLQTKFGTSMILITHDLGVIAETSDDVAVIYAGQIVEYGSKRSVFKKTAHPYTIGLFESLPDISSEWLKPITGMPPDPTNLPEGCAFSPRCPYAEEQCRHGEIPFVEVDPGHFCKCCLKQAGGTYNG